MFAWAAPVASPVARARLGDAPGLALYDARTGAVEKTNPGDEARLYVCGITPYDATHIGHAATYVAFDLAVRAWREAGHRVRYVQNVTDVDDPLLERARQSGEDWRALADREIQLFRDDMAALSVVPPDEYPGAVETIPLVVDMVKELQAKGAVYDVDGDLYFCVSSDPAFGQVSGLGRDEMLPLFGERGGDPDRPGKRDPLDCLVWQQQRAGEPGWTTDLGTGRPGWHVECSAIAVRYLGAAFDIQGGGSDLIFPHHEMSASECQVARPGEPFAKAYAHAGMVGLDGRKMSKSLGNLVLVSGLRESGVDPRVIRLALLSRHYRTDWEWTDSLLTAAEDRLARWTAAVRRGSAFEGGARDRDFGVAGGGVATATAVRVAMADDLNAPRALTAVDAWAADDSRSDSADARIVAAVAEASLGISLATG